jgi:hypothetical protein
MMDNRSRRDIILGTVSDLVANFLYYDRKGDEDLPRGQIEEAIENKEITADEIVELFKKELENNI